MAKNYDDKKVVYGFKRRMKGLGKNAETAVKLCSALVKTESQKIVPVDEGNLRASAYTAFERTSKRVTGEVGFTAKYAKWVHEMPMVLKGLARRGKNAKGKYWDPQGTATNKFLQKAVNNNRQTLINIFRKLARRTS